ncbi:MAG: MotA/TolQ/ExbB proton channel family protein [Thermoguttaceae bacterium]|jgi:biopolymer transport protein ExbB
MNATRRAVRCAIFSRTAICLAAFALFCAPFPAAHAQETGPRPLLPPVAKAADAKGDVPPATKLTPAEAERLAEAALAEGEPGKKDAAPAEAKVAQFNIIEVIRKGGVHMWAVYFILLLSVVAVAFAFERLLGLRRSRVVPRDLIVGLKKLANPGSKTPFDPRRAMKLCQQYPSSAATVIKTILQKTGRPVAEIEHAATESGEREATRLYANVRWQNLTFNVAPMLGLAGTVHGIILAFFDTAHMPLGVNKMESLSTGIYAALICTLAGLVVAIPAGVLAHVFEGRILKLLRELDDVVRLLIPQMEQFEGVPRTGGKVRLPPAAESPPPSAPPQEQKSNWPVVAP